MNHLYRYHYSNPDSDVDHFYVIDRYTISMVQKREAVPEYGITELKEQYAADVVHVLYFPTGYIEEVYGENQWCEFLMEYVDGVAPKGEQYITLVRFDLMSEDDLCALVSKPGHQGILNLIPNPSDRVKRAHNLAHKL